MKVLNTVPGRREALKMWTMLLKIPKLFLHQSRAGVCVPSETVCEGRNWCWARSFRQARLYE